VRGEPQGAEREGPLQPRHPRLRTAARPAAAADAHPAPHVARPGYSAGPPRSSARTRFLLPRCALVEERSPPGVSWRRLATVVIRYRGRAWSMMDEILTLPEVAQLLKVAEKTVYTMAQKGELPAFKVRGQWRFKRVDLDQWIEQQKAASARDEGGES